MLVTNYSTGELSENLFGRIDIPQYYSGAAKVENFDIIPTGGIKKRIGTEFLKDLSLNGRLIPFPVNRNKGFLLCFFNNGLCIYKVENEIVQTEGDTITKIGDRNISYKDSEIKEIKYAQNFNTMILVHENHPPLEVKYNGETLLLNWLEISFRISVEVGKDVTDEEKANYNFEDDNHYKDNCWLTSSGNYPRTVSFYNGRLIFAGTKNNPQHIFASAIKEENKPYNFATKKIFLTPEKKYTVYFGKILHDNTSIIETTDIKYIANFTEPTNEYIVESRLYPADTRIEYFNLKRLKLTNEANVLIQNIEGIKAILNGKITAYDNMNNNPHQVLVFERTRKFTYLHSYYNVNVNYIRESKIHCNVKARSIDVVRSGREYDIGQKEGAAAGISETKWRDITPSTIRTITLPEDAAKYLETNPNYYDQIIIDGINAAINQEININFPGMVPLPSYTNTDDKQYHSNEPAITKLYQNINSTMVYELKTEYSEETKHDTPLNILTWALSWINDTDHTYIPFYTKKIIEDRYPTPDCGFFFEIASDMNDAIRWLAANRGLIVGTETGEHIIPTDVHATNIRAIPISSHGSDKIQGIRVGNATCFFRTGKKELVEYYPNEYDNFRANNMALLSPQMLSESSVIEIDYVSAPYTKLLITREDGTIATLLYERSTGTFAWGRIITNGKIKSLAVLPGEDGNDDIYLIVERKNKYYLERLKESQNIYLDNYQELKTKTQYLELKGKYGNEAKLCFYYVNEKNKEIYETYNIEKEPDFTKKGSWYIGYLYKSVIRTMPVITNDKLKKTRIINIHFRFLNSYMPEITNIENGEEGSTNILTPDEPFSGVHRQLYPGGSNEDVQVELNSEIAAPVKILALYAETDGGK